MNGAIWSRNSISVLVVFFAFSLALGLNAEEAERSTSFYYKPDYNKGHLIVIQRIGAPTLDLNETWAIDPADVPLLKKMDLQNGSMESINVVDILRKTVTHLKQRFPDAQFAFSNFSLEILPAPSFSYSGNAQLNRSYYLMVEYLKIGNGGRASVERVPVLLDGRIVLSDCE